MLADLSVGTMILTGKSPGRAMEQLRELGPGDPGSRNNAISRVLLTMFDHDEPAAEHAGGARRRP